MLRAFKQLVDSLKARPYSLLDFTQLAFDADLRRRDVRWGLRRLADVAAEATAAGLDLRERVAMPTNNLLLVWRKQPWPGPTAKAQP